MSVCIHDSGPCGCGRMFLAVYVGVSECARDVCVCVCVTVSLLSMSG